MPKIINVHTPDGKSHRHVSSLQNGNVEAHRTADGSIQVLGVKDTPRIELYETIRPATHFETVLGTYPPGSRVESIG